MYKGYERKWSGYKVFVMVVKLALVMPIIFLWDHQLAQTLVTMGILLVFAGMSLYTTPFISPAADYMDMSGRFTGFTTVMVAMIGSPDVAPDTSTGMSWLINIVNAINLVIMLIAILSGFPAVRHMAAHPVYAMQPVSLR